MKKVYKEFIEVTLFMLFVIMTLFLSYKITTYSYNYCEDTNLSIEDYRFCINI